MPPRPTIVRKLAEGETATTYLARDDGGRSVVLKVLAQKNVTPHWEREILFLTKLKFPGLVSLLGYDPKGPCYWMEYVEGRPILEAAAGASPDRIAAWFREGLETLGYLHRNGVLHGDVAPNNLMVASGESRLRLLDFGLAQRSMDRSGVTGTLPYTAPEVFQGARSRQSDLFSLGTVFYEAFAGKHPRAGCRDVAEIIRAVPPALSRGIAGRVVERLIAVPLNERLPSADAALAALTASGKKRSHPEMGAARFHSFEMLGADAHFKNVREILETLPSVSRAVAVHGATGVGKSRFLSEAATWLSLQGVTPEILSFDAVAELSDENKTALLHLHERLRSQPGRLALLEWNDERLSTESRDIFKKVLAWPETVDVPLQPLNERDAGALIRLALGDADAKAVRTLFQRSGGNPGLLLQWLEAIRARAGTKPLSAILADFHAAGDGLRFWELRLLDLDAEDLSLLARFAAAGEPVARNDVNGEDALSRLKDVSLVREDAGTYEPASPLIGETLAARYPDAWKKAHEGWLKRLKTDSFPNVRKLRHAIALKDKTLTAEGLRVTCEKLQTGKRTSEALRLLEAGLTLLDDKNDKDEISRCLRLKINLLNASGHYDDAAKACDDWTAAEGRDEPASLQALKRDFIRGFIAANQGRFAEARAPLESCLKRTEKNPEEGADYGLRARALLGKILIALGSPEDLDRADTVLREAEALAQGKELAEILRNHGLVAARRGDWPRAAADFERSGRLYEDADYAPGIFSTWLQAGLSAVEADRPQEASDFYARAEDVALRRNDERSLASVWTNQGVLARKSGHLSAALGLAKRSEEIFEFLANPRDLAAFHRHLGAALAAVGRFDEAAESLARLEALSPSDAADLAAFLGELKDGIFGESEKPSLDLDFKTHWNFEEAVRRASRRGDAEADFLKTALEKVFADLPPELQVTFMERYDYRRWIDGKTETPKAADEPARDAASVPPSLLAEITRLNQALVGEEDIPKVLVQLMDAALRLSGAENGCLLVPDDGAAGPLPGFSAAVSRNMSFDAGAPAYSVSAVKRAVASLEPVVTDNALQDERFRDAKSVHARNLRSIFVLPVVSAGTVLGIFYLDHRLEDGLFRPSVIEALKAFASLAALALQKGRLIAGLKRSNAELAHEVEEQSDEVEKLHREVLESRRILKNEYKDIVGRSPKMMDVLSLVDRITDAKISVWIYGESGTGKEAVARSLHYNSARAKQAFVSENCSSLPETLLESELFGHKKGAFTQAVQDKKGLLEFAHKGTVFLDEIADMSINLQSKLLRFLQEGEIRPLGSNQVLRVDVRVVSASNKDLKKLVAEGKFREDLYYRLNGVTVRLPPLRDRREDIPLLAAHFLKRIAEREDRKALKLEAAALRFLMKQSWPGNIRQLQNVIETSALFAEKNVVTARALQSVLTETELKATPASALGQDLPPDLKRIVEAIQAECFNRSKAAKTLGMSRRHLYRKLAKYGLNREEDLKVFVEGRTV